MIERDPSAVHQSGINLVVRGPRPDSRIIIQRQNREVNINTFKRIDAL